jgi:predicted nucleic acid-binding protein
MILVDTSVWIDYFSGKETQQVFLLDDLLKEDRIIIGDLILTELLQGFRYKRDLIAISEVVKLLEYRDLVGKEIAEKSAENYRYLRRKGATVRKTIDVIIGTFCIENGINLLHADRDFDPMEKHLGLKVIQ